MLFIFAKTPGGDSVASSEVDLPVQTERSQGNPYRQTPELDRSGQLCVFPQCQLQLEKCSAEKRLC